MLKYRFYVECSFGGSHHEIIEIPLENIRGMTEIQIDEYASSLYEDWLIEMCNGGYEKIEIINR